MIFEHSELYRLAVSVFIYKSKAVKVILTDRSDCFFMRLYILNNLSLSENDDSAWNNQYSTPLDSWSNFSKTSTHSYPVPYKM